MSAIQHRLKYVATVNDEALGEDTDASFEMGYVDISNVDSSGNIGEIATYRFEDAPSRARRRVRDGDVIISTVRTYLQAITQIRTPRENLIVSTGFAVIRPRRDVFDARYCKYALREPEFLAEVERRSVGVNYPAINASDLASIPVHLHPLPKQRVIADYLDRETTRIDALIAAKERLLGLLAEKRRALITRAVTRGLDPNTPLRDSGVPWLGKIPAHWPLVRGKFLWQEQSLPVREDDEMVTCFRDGQVTLRRNRREEGFTNANKELGYQGIRAGSLLFTQWTPLQGPSVSLPRMARRLPNTLFVIQSKVKSLIRTSGSCCG
jgi:type I restriction enzyme S subunit